MRLFFKLGHNFVIQQFSATCCQDDTLEAHTDLEYETGPHPPYSPDLSPAEYHFFQASGRFFMPKNISF